MSEAKKSSIFIRIIVLCGAALFAYAGIKVFLDMQGGKGVNQSANNSKAEALKLAEQWTQDSLKAMKSLFGILESIKDEASIPAAKTKSI